MAGNHRRESRFAVYFAVAALFGGCWSLAYGDQSNVNRIEQSVVLVATNKGSGSGVIIDPRGVVLTNHHVIEGATQLLIVPTGRSQGETATVLGVDKSRDLAVLSFKSSGLPAIKISTVIPNKGAKVRAFGFPGAADQGGDS